MSLEGKVALVTGAGRGLGKGIALQLAARGAAVAVNDVTVESAQGTVDEILKNGGRAAAFACNVANFAEVEAMIAEAEKALGPIGILVNNAGINRDARLVKMTEQQWDEVIAVDLKSQFNTLRTLAPLMTERQFGRVINVSSASWQGNFGQANYAAAKAGVIGLTKTACRELAKYNITVNAICPGFIETEMTRGVPEKVWDVMVSKIPAGRVGKPEDVGRVVAFLASDDASYVNGEVIAVGGGMVL